MFCGSWDILENVEVGEFLQYDVICPHETAVRKIGHKT